MRSGTQNGHTAGSAFGGDDVSYALALTTSQHSTVNLTNSGTTYLVYNAGAAAAGLNFQGQFNPTFPSLAFPTDGTPGNVMVIPPGAWRVITAPPNAKVSGLMLSGTGTVYIQPGEGGTA